MNRPLTAGLLLAGALVFIAASTLMFIPERVVEGIVKGAIEEGMAIRYTRAEFKKVFPAGFSMHDAEFFSADDPSRKVHVDRVVARLRPLYLFRGELRHDIRLESGQGAVDATFARGIREKRLFADINGFAMEAMPFLDAPAFFNKSGVMTGRLEINLSGANNACPEAEAYFKLKNAMLPEGIGALFIGFRDGVTASISASLGSDCGLDVKELWVYWHGAKARGTGTIALKRDIRKSDIDLAIEVMPGSGAGDALLSALSRYKKTEDYYSMRLSGQLDSPLVME